MSKFEFACSLFGYNRIMNKSVSAAEIDNAFEEWKFSLMSFNDWIKIQKIKNN